VEQITGSEREASSVSALFYHLLFSNWSHSKERKATFDPGGARTRELFKKLLCRDPNKDSTHEGKTAVSLTDIPRKPATCK